MCIHVIYVTSWLCIWTNPLKKHMYRSPSVLQPFVLRLPRYLEYKTMIFVPKFNFVCYWTFILRPDPQYIGSHLHNPIDGLKIKRLLYNSLTLARSAWGRYSNKHVTVISNRADYSRHHHEDIPSKSQMCDENIGRLYCCFQEGPEIFWNNPSAYNRVHFLSLRT